MKTVNVTIRGVKGLKRKAFETMKEITESLKEADIVRNMNAYLGAHPFNSAVESGIVDLAESKGFKMLTKKSEKSGRDVIIESNAKFLERIKDKFKPTREQVQEIVDGLAWPPVAKPRGDRVDAFTKVAQDRVEKALAGGRSLESIIEGLGDKGIEVSDETQEGVIAALAEHLRTSELV